MVYTYYDYLENYYEYYYEYEYWPYYYGNYNGSNTTYNGTYPPSPWKQPYPMDIFNPFFWGTSLLCAILAIIIGSFIFYQIYLRIKEGTMRSNHTTIGLTVGCIALHIIFCCLDPVSYAFWYIDYSPNVIDYVDIVWDIFWCLSKISVYLVFMNRYYNIFKAATTMDATGKRRKYIMFGLFMFTIFAQMVFISLYIIFYYIFESDQGGFESKRSYLNMCWAFLVLDFLSIGAIGYLLNKSILKLIVATRAMNNISAREASKSAVPTTTRRNTQTMTVEASHVQQESKGSKDETELADYQKQGHDTPDPASPPSTHHEMSHVANHSEETSAYSTTNTMAVIRRKVKQKRSKSKKDDVSGRDKLINTTTRIALTCVISMVSSLLYQLIWNIAEEFEEYDLLWFTYTWSIDGIINMLCVYLSMGIANDHYRLLCHDICKCHQCCLKAIMGVISYSTEKKERKLTELHDAAEDKPTADV